MADPTQTDPDKYKVVFENERVRVLEYRDDAGQQKNRPHRALTGESAVRQSVHRILMGLWPETQRWADAEPEGFVDVHLQR